MHDRRFIGGNAVLEVFAQDLSADVEGVATAKEELIASQDYVLTPARYAHPAVPKHAGGERRQPVTTLGEIAEVVKPQFLPGGEGARKGVEVSEVSPGDVPEYGYLETGARSRLVDSSTFASRSKQILQPNDVLLSSKGTIGRVGIVGRLEGNQPLLASQSLLILRIREGSAVDPRYLAMYLRSPVAQRTLESLAVGMTIRNISLSDIKALEIPLAKLDQTQLIQAFDKLAELQESLKNAKTDQRTIATKVWKAAGLDIQDGSKQ